MNKIKAVIFDVDGVLIRGTDDSGNFLWKKNLEKDLGISKQIVRRLFKEYWPQIGTGKLDTLDAIGQFLSSIESDLSPQEFMTYWHKNDSNVDVKMVEAVKSLRSKGYQLFLGTNQEKYRAKYMWENLGFQNYFKDIFASCYIGFEKPNQHYFEAVQEKIGLNSDEIVFIDDSQLNVEAAKNLGWHSFLHNCYEETEKNLLRRLI